MQDLLNDSTFWFAISFVLFIVLAVKMGTKPIMAALDGYATRIKSELEQAAALNAEASRLLAETEAKHAGALREADDIVAHAREQAAALQKQAQDDLAATLKHREQQAVDRIALLEEQAKDEIRARAVDVAVRAAEALLATHMNDAADSKIIDAATGHMATKLKKSA